MANPIVDMFRVKELRQRILYTLGWLMLFRLGCYLPIPGINASALTAYFASAAGSSGITDYLDFFNGGAFKNFSVFMMGVMPYISTQIIMQLVIIVVPSLKKISEEEGGKKRVARWTRIGTIFVCIIQGLSVTVMANNIKDAITMDRTAYAFVGILTVSAGSMFLVWIGEQITKRGIGNGISLLIFAGIVARMPNAAFELYKSIERNDVLAIFALVVIVLFVAVVAMVIMEQQGQRKIPITYARRVVGRKQYGGGPNTYIPFKLNPSGVIPVIFASSILTFPAQIAQNLGKGTGYQWLNDISSFLNPRGFAYNALYVAFIIFFAYFYTQVTLNPQQISKNIRENGGSIPGIRSEKMEEHLTKILNRIILPGSLYLGLIALLPTLVMRFIPGFPQQMALLMGGTSSSILVGVDLDTMAQVNALLKMHHHEGLTRKGHIRSRNL